MYGHENIPKTRIFVFQISCAILISGEIRRHDYFVFLDEKLRRTSVSQAFKALFPRPKLTQVVFTRHFSKLTRVEPELVVFTRQTNPGRTRVSGVYTIETNPG